MAFIGPTNSHKSPFCVLPYNPVLDSNNHDLNPIYFCVVGLGMQIEPFICNIK